MERHFCLCSKYIGIPKGTIKATVLIETILAAFEMDEIYMNFKGSFSWIELWQVGLYF